MKTPLVLCLSAAVLFAPLVTRADNEIGFIEKFALAQDREAVLGQLLPGSEDFYFFHALHYQNTKQAAKLAETMEQWAKRFPNSERRLVIENRSALLAYDADPQKTLQFLRDRLHLEFDHQQEVRDQKPDLPTKLNPALISRAAFQKHGLELMDNNVGAFEVEALADLIRDKVPLKASHVRVILSYLIWPDVPGLLELVLTDLKSAESKGFGEFKTHRFLLPEQMDELAKRIPSLMENQEFVKVRLQKLSAGADADVEFDPVEREAWLDRVWGYAKNLSPSFNSLKAQILLLRLQFDRTRGVYDKARFIEYLKLPRRTNYVSAEYLRRAELNAQIVDVNADYQSVLGTVPPLRSDETLVREYLVQLLKDEPSWEPWAVWLKDTWLKPIFAESKIVHGVGNPERWASLLSATAFQALKERVDVDFAANNPPFLKPADDVSIDVFVKNSPKLIVKIYEINTLSYFLANQRELNTDLALEGLVANQESTHDFSADDAGRSPFRRTLRTFKFPELKGKRGAWVIEFIGGGKSSRALVRKGQWSVLQKSGPAGEMLTVLDESRQPVKGAVAWLDGRKIVPDEKSGYLLLPFTNEPGDKKLVLADPAGEFASLAPFWHSGENYELRARFHIEREQLLARREATVAMRSSLLLGGSQVSLDLLKNPRLSISTIGGPENLKTTTEIDVGRLDPAKVFTHKFTVPVGTTRVEVELNAEVEKWSEGGKKESLVAKWDTEINRGDDTPNTKASHLSRFEGRYVYELLGKNGEPIPDRQVVFSFFSRSLLAHQRVGIQVPLRTDEAGRVDLGGLEGIRFVETRCVGNDDGTGATWAVEESGRTWASDIHARAGEAITIPWQTAAAPARVSLLEWRGGTIVADRSAAATIKPAAVLLNGLAPGDYWLNAPGNESVTIKVTAGEVVGDWLVSPNRELEIPSAAPVYVESVVREPQAVVVQVGNTNPWTRVHVAATRFLPSASMGAELRTFRDNFLGEGPTAKLPNLYSGGRMIGDEYRYILERRYSKTYPGNMLSRPGLVLNPWEIRSTDLQAQEMAVMQKAQATAGGRPAAKKTEQAEKAGGIVEFAPNGMGATNSPNMDFLAVEAQVIFNLVPDKEGKVRIDAKLLGDRQYLQIYAEDLDTTAWRSLALPEVPTKFQDLRMARNLDPQKAFAVKREMATLQTGQSITLADVLTADMETYDTIGGVYALLTTLSDEDENLAKFTWLMKWPTLKDEEKRAKYSEFACHELNIFLSRKDPAFFEKVVQPYLRNKKDRTFLDDYLLGNDLKAYLEPWAYARLNMAERALLGRRLPTETAAAQRHLRELWEMVPPDAERENELFETALRGRSHETRAPGGAGLAEVAPIVEEIPGLVPAAPAAAAAPVPAPAKPAMAGAMMLAADARSSKGEADKRKDLAEAGPADVQLRGANTLTGAVSGDFAFMDGAEVARQRALVRQFFRALGPTKEWAENNYYQLRIGDQNAELIPINAFWRDYAAWDGKTPFLSAHVIEATHSFSEMMLALAMLDLPFEAPKHTSKREGNQYTLTAGGPLIAFHKQIKPAAVAPADAQLLVSQNFYRADDRYREEGNEKFDKYVTKEFLSGVVYGADVVVTNPTSTPQKVTALLQIPRGAVPVNGSLATDSRWLRVEPYTTQRLSYSFYFPAPNAAQEELFPHYPVQIARDEQIVGSAKAFEFKVVKQLSEIDQTSWEYLSQYGSDADVFAFLDKANLERIDLEKIAWRARKSADFLRKLVTLLESRHIYSEPIYRYSIVHNATAPLAVWLRNHEDFIGQCGSYLDAKLLKIDPIERRAYEHLEYTPLVNQRTHRLGAENRIANPMLRGQYQALLNVLAYKPTLDAVDQMSVTYYLFLQDRVEEGLARFHNIAPAALPTRLQHDYFRAYTAFYEEQPSVARGLVQQYADYPVDRWRKLFAEVGAQLDEIEGKAVTRPGDDQPNREKQQGELAATEPSFDFKVENRQIALTWKNLTAVTVNYYLMDPEFMFSASPFVTQDTGSFSIIKPTKSATLTLPAGQDVLAVPLPGEFAKANVLVEILGAGQRRAQAYHANTLKLTLAEAYGQLEARDETAGKPVSKAYVKVYARLRNGTVRYYKDGYTDLRGKFDYASLNSSEGAEQPIPLARNSTGDAAGLGFQMLTPAELGQVEKLAILLMSDAHGTMVREVAPPRQ